MHASYQVSVHLDTGFQRRRLKCDKLTDDRRRTPSDSKSSSCLWQGELKMGKTYSAKQAGAILRTKSHSITESTRVAC